MRKTQTIHPFQHQFTILTVLFLMVLCHACKHAPPIVELNTPQTFNLLGTDSAIHNVNLKQDKYYNFTIDQKGIDVMVNLVNDKQEILKSKDSPNGNFGPEQFYFYCEEEGEYQVQIKPFIGDDTLVTGNYTISISEMATDTKISLARSKYLADFKTFKAIFEAANAGLYRYHSKQEVDSVFLANMHQINHQTTYLEFYNLIWQVIDYTGSCHNNLRLPQYLTTLLYRKAIFFPIPLKYIDGKLYSNGNYNGIPSGAEITKINSITATEFANRISRYRSTDGFNQTAKYNFIQTDWAPLYIYYVFGEVNAFTIEYKINSTVKSVNINSVDYPTYWQHYDQRHSAPDEIKDDYHYEYFEDADIGYLSINTFNVGEKGNESYAEYATFLDSVFITLKNKTNLIVDIRGNGGGRGDALMLLTTYLSHRPVKENTKAYTLFNTLPYPEYYIGSVQNTEAFLADYVNGFDQGKHYQNNKYNPVWEPNPNRYQGHFVLLIDPFVASAASHFAAHIKSDQNATLIGEETGGGYYGHTGHYSVQYELPHSKLVLSFSIVDLNQDVRELNDQGLGNGIVPDIRIVQSHEDFLKHRDTQLNFALNYLKNKI